MSDHHEVASGSTNKGGGKIAEGFTAIGDAVWKTLEAGGTSMANFTLDTSKAVGGTAAFSASLGHKSAPKVDGGGGGHSGGGHHEAAHPSH
jgi:hypothetical protein